MFSYTKTVDKYGGVHYDIDISRKGGFNLKNDIQKAMTSSRYKSCWINFKIPFKWSRVASVIPDSFVMDGKTGGYCMDYQSDTPRFRIWQWISNKRCSIPTGANFAVGANGMVLDTINKKIILLCHEHYQEYYYLPGGHYEQDDGRDPINTAHRECQEEIGILIPKSNGVLVGVSEFPNNPLAPGLNLVYIFEAPGASEQELPADKESVRKAVWYDYQQVLECGGMLDGKKVGDEIIKGLRGYLEGIVFKRQQVDEWLTTNCPLVSDI